MASTLRQRAFDGPRQMLSGAYPPDMQTGKKLSDDEIVRLHAADLRRMFELAGAQKKEGAADIEHANQSTISKLLNPDKPSPLSRILAVPRYKRALILAMAETTPGINCQMVITADMGKAVNS
jgi:hypothetical protein